LAALGWVVWRGVDPQNEWTARAACPDRRYRNAGGLSGLDHALPIRGFHPARAFVRRPPRFLNAGKFPGTGTAQPDTGYLGCTPSRGKLVQA
jgi:hypothetical protein